MTDPLFAVFDIGLAFGFVLALATWQLVSLKRSIRADRKQARRDAEGPPRN